MSRYKQSISYKWTSPIAYLAGLIASDGCLVNNGRHLNITSTDKEIIDYSQEILCKKGLKVQIKWGQFGTKAFSWQFSDVSLYDFFWSNGITSRKSKTIKSVNIPNEYWGDFLRGYFDGDGSVYSYMDKRWVDSFMFYTCYASASLQFLEWMQSRNSLLALTTPGSIRTSTNVLVLGYAKSDSRLLYKSMYGEGTCAEKYSLQRKRIKMEAFINRGKHGII